MKTILSVLLTLIAVLSYAQTGTIRGSVIEDQTGDPVMFANILVKETAAGGTTDLDGAFSVQVPAGTYTLEITYVGLQNLTIEGIEVVPGKVTLLNDLRMSEIANELSEVVVTAAALRNTESALMTIKKKAPAMLDGISSARFQITGDATAVEAAKRVTGVSIEGGKYVYVRGLGDRYSKTTLNGMEIPGLDPDRNTLQMDIFPTNLLSNIMVSKNFTADMPADFTGGLMNIETKDFPTERTLSISVGTEYNPNIHFRSDYLSYKGGGTDFLGYDDGTRSLPDRAREPKIPTPISGTPQEVNDFVNSFGKELGTQEESSILDFSAGFSYGNQIAIDRKNNSGIRPGNRTLGLIFSLSYKSDYTYYSDFFNGEYQRPSDPDMYELVYANRQSGSVGERSILIGAMGGIAYKARLFKIRLTAMRLQNGVSRAGKFSIDNNGSAVGQSGYRAMSDNLEYNQRALTNFLLHGTHVTENSGWEIDWRLSPTLSQSDDPDIRKTAFTQDANDGSYFFSPGAGGNPKRIWRELEELNAVGKIDVTKKYTFNNQEARLKFGVSHIYKERDYEILSYDALFFGRQPQWPGPDPSLVMMPSNIYGSPEGGRLYIQSGNNFPNPNEYNSNVNNTGAYISNEFTPFGRMKAILGIRMENFTQRHTGRDQAGANGTAGGNVLENEKVLESLDLFPSVNLIYGLNDRNNIRAAYSRTIARPSFKELSFAQILDPVSNRIFNGGLFPYSDWDGNLVETRIDNVDLRWELFMEGSELFSVSAFYKRFDKPIELVRIPEAQTSTEFQPRNVGNGQVYGLEFEIRKNLDFIAPALRNFNLNTNVTLVQSEIDMSDREFNARKNYERTGEEINGTRQMAGQAPYVINAGLTYSLPERGFEAGFFYNVKGRTLSVVGVGLYPDVYIDSFNSLNFSLVKRFGPDFRSSIDFKVSNILNERWEHVFVSYEAQEQFYNRYNPGIAFSLGYSHNF